MQNVNLLFNKLYYDELHFDNNGLEIGKIKEKRDSLIKSRFYKDDYQECKLPEVSRLYFKTLYPGLLAGTGYAHGVSSEEDAKLGFSLDYVTGQPYVPGSSVKGIIRSVFDNTEIIKEIIKEKTPREFNDTEISDLIKEIFEGNDVFLDAVIYKGDAEGRVLGTDYITPHKDPVKNPVPLQMIKILPDVTMEFRFILKGGILSVKEKENIFSQIIEDFGVGAKTNVGYGNIIKIDQPEIEQSKAIYPTCTEKDRLREADAIVANDKTFEKNQSRAQGGSKNNGLRQSENAAESKGNKNGRNNSNKSRYTKDEVYEFEVTGTNGKKAICHCLKLDCDEQIHPLNIQPKKRIKFIPKMKISLKFLGIVENDGFKNLKWELIENK